MAVARNDDRHAAVARDPGVDVVQVEPIALTIDLERHAVACRGRHDRLDIQGIGLTLENEPPGRMAEDVHIRVFDRLKEPLGHLLPILIERLVHRRDDEVEGGEAVVGEIERAVGADVAFDAGEQADAEPFGVDRAHA